MGYGLLTHPPWAGRGNRGILIKLYIPGGPPRSTELKYLEFDPKNLPSPPFPGDSNKPKCLQNTVAVYFFDSFKDLHEKGLSSSLLVSLG